MSSTIPSLLLSKAPRLRFRAYDIAVAAMARCGSPRSRQAPSCGWSDLPCDRAHQTDLASPFPLTKNRTAQSLDCAFLGYRLSLEEKDSKMLGATLFPFCGQPASVSHDSCLSPARSTCLLHLCLQLQCHLHIIRYSMKRTLPLACRSAPKDWPLEKEPGSVTPLSFALLSWLSLLLLFLLHRLSLSFLFHLSRALTCDQASRLHSRASHRLVLVIRSFILSSAGLSTLLLLEAGTLSLPLQTYSCTHLNRTPLP